MNQFKSDKILKHLDRIVAWQKTGISRPITYELDMTNVCNSKCPFCFGFYGRETSHATLTIQEARTIIRQISVFGGKGLTFTGGGDPLCNPATMDAVAYARQRGLDIGFITNGILLDDKKMDVLVENCTWIRVSLDAGTRELYLRTHGLNGTTFDTVVKNVELLVRKKREKRSPVTIGTGFLTFSGVANDMQPFVKISRNAGVDYAQFRPLLKKFEQTEFNAAADADILDQVQKCRAMATKHFSVLCSVHKYSTMEQNNFRRGYAQCYGHHFAAVISADRKMYLCCHMRGNKKYCIGDLRKNTLREIWNSARRRKVFEKINFADCPLLCRCDGFNTKLWDIVQPAAHVNFL